MQINCLFFLLAQYFAFSNRVPQSVNRQKFLVKERLHFILYIPQEKLGSISLPSIQNLGKQGNKCVERACSKTLSYWTSTLN